METIGSKGLLGMNSVIKEGRNIIVVECERGKDEHLDYIDKKYDEGWEIVAVTHDTQHNTYTLHKRKR